jgi:hypothetical protein
MDRLNLRSRVIYIPAIIIALALIIAGVWWLSIERLPGYNTEPIHKMSFVEPGGLESEYFTGTVSVFDISILGPKMSVVTDVDKSNRTFFLPTYAPVWLGLVFGDKGITGQEKVTYNDIKVGQRVAVFIGPVNRARRVNILKR